MQKIYKILAACMASVFLMSFAVMIYAADTSGYCSNTGSYSLKTSTWPLIQCGNAGQHCCDFTEAAILVNRIITWFIGISISVAAITFSIAGAQMLLNPDNPGKRQEAIDMFKKTVIGMLLVLGAWLIVNTIVSAVINPKIDALRFLK